jgi:uncharacterized cupredoxin-like copper-binding protein
MARTSAIAFGVLSAALIAAASQAQPGGAAAPDWNRAEVIEVAMTNFAYTPKTIRLRQGMPYRLHFVNNASNGHSFQAPQFFQSATVAAEDRAKITGGNVEVGSGMSVDVRLVPGAAASYPVRCAHFLHATFGMTGDIVVE